MKEKSVGRSISFIIKIHQIWMIVSVVSKHRLSLVLWNTNKGKDESHYIYTYLLIMKPLILIIFNGR